MKRIITTIVMIVLIVLMSSNVYAATGVINAGASTAEIEKGKIFTVTIAATADAPIDAIYTKINYDTKVLKQLEKEDLEILEDSYTDNSLTGEIFLINDPYKSAPNSATLCKIKFTVLANAKEGATTISFDDSELHLNDKAEEIEIEEIDVVVKAKESINTDTDKDTGTDTDTDKDTDTDTDKDKDTDDNTNKNDKLPQTGLEGVSILLSIVLIALVIVAYISRKKYKGI